MILHYHVYTQEDDNNEYAKQRPNIKSVIFYYNTFNDRF